MSYFFTPNKSYSFLRIQFICFIYSLLRIPHVKQRRMLSEQLLSGQIVFLRKTTGFFKNLEQTTSCNITKYFFKSGKYVTYCDLKFIIYIVATLIFCPMRQWLARRYLMISFHDFKAFEPRANFIKRWLVFRWRCSSVLANCFVNF